ncbi:2-succinyl-5-enolpyruvyl-6-hydroxy-3-cyclohexene-1-carboxylic-acid synthase [Ascidiimonas aurantiaca]|uniref:2-succinyl-5-enolpyruvyl-6-hydroxy-3- cyclohexene-1-carboxylic-acid synthase n=1 Tax=Ascidiimonas aurantiaca TaxID=1685432 RepID=UPI0030EB1278
MKYPGIKLARSVVGLCKAYEVRHIIISPGSRNAPLTMGFYEDSAFTCYSIVDERCAAFFGMGIAQQTREPVVLVCTSGSALLNYYPAISEAFYSTIPLVVLSADRPASKIDIGDGQTIRQPDVFQNHILLSVNLSDEDDRLAENETLVSEALSTAINQQGPVHINVPFEEPLYEMVNTPANLSVQPSERIQNSSFNIADSKIQEFTAAWQNSAKKMVLTGVNSPNALEDSAIRFLGNREDVIVFTETTSNLYHDRFFPSIDKVIAPVEKDEEALKGLRPDMLVTFGGMIISKKIKAFLRKYPPKYHFHIHPTWGFDTFFCLTHHFKTDPGTFFRIVLKNLSPSGSVIYREKWFEVLQKRRAKHATYTSVVPFSDFLTYHHIFRSVPAKYQVQLSNSSTVRYAQLFDLDPSLTVFCNRGTSGIDGSTSTALGAAVVSKTPVLLVTGDLSFFYDSNALWNSYIPNSFRIIVINNGGGGIFRILPGPKHSKKFSTYFETRHTLNASHLCNMFGLKYMSAHDESSLDFALSHFYNSSGKPVLLEVFTPNKINDEVLIRYFDFIR